MSKETFSRKLMCIAVAALAGVLALSTVTEAQFPVDLTTQLSKFLVDLRAGTLGVANPITTATTSGLMTSSAHTLTAGPLTIGTNPAQTGNGIRVPNNFSIIYARNAANSGNIPFLYLDTNNIWQIDETSVGLQFGAGTFAALGTPANGVMKYCSDCTIASPCAGAGTGALAKRLNGVWVCN